MSSTYAEPIARLEECLDEIAECSPAYRTTAEKQEALAALSRAKVRLEAELMRVLACADDVAEATGARTAPGPMSGGRCARGGSAWRRCESSSRPSTRCPQRSATTFGPRPRPG